MAPPNFPVKYADVKAKLSYEEACPAKFTIGSVTFIPIPLSHPNGGSGYKFVEDGKEFVFLTDNELGYIHNGGLSFEEYVEFAADADLPVTTLNIGTTPGGVATSWSLPQNAFDPLGVMNVLVSWQCDDCGTSPNDEIKVVPNPLTGFIRATAFTNTLSG